MKPIRLAIVGCGSYAGVHAHRFKSNPDVHVVACVDVDTATVQRFITRHLGDLPAGVAAPAVFTDLGQMLARIRPDAVAIATPHMLHFEHISAALDAGCHVFVEKPMTVHAEHARIVKRKVADAGKVLVVGYNTPCTPEFQYLRRAIRDPHGPGCLGPLHVVNGYLSQNWMRGTTGSWRQEPALSGGGMAYDSGAHILNSLCWSVGSHVADVYACADDRGAKVDINAAITVRFINGVLACIAIAGDCASDGSHMTYCFAGGRIDVDGWNGEWIDVHNAFGRVKYPPITDPPRTPDDNFIDAIRGRAEPMSTPEHGVIQSELMDAIYESTRTGQPARPQRKV